MVKKMSRRMSSLKSFFTSKKNIPKILVIAGIVVMFGVFGYTMVHQGADISRLQRQRDEIAVKVEGQLQTNEELKSVLENDNKDDYIEQKAREKGYVKSNEIVFYDISASE